LLGKMPALGRHRRNWIADEPHRIVERVAPLLRDLLDVVVVLLAAGDAARAPDDLAVLAGDDCLHALERPSFRSVDGSNTRVRMRAPQHPGVEHSRQLDVVGVLRASGDALDGVDARRRVPDGRQGRERR
jgi:hypothetical protein